MKKILFTNFEKIMNGLGIIALLYSLIDALLVAREQMLISEEGLLGMLTFVLSFSFTFTIDIALSTVAILIIYLLSDVRMLLINLNPKKQ